MAKAFAWRNRLEVDNLTDRELSRKEKVDRRYMSKIMKLTFLAPDIIEAIMIGSQPNKLRLVDLLKSPIPISWAEQRIKYGFINS